MLFLTNFVINYLQNLSPNQINFHKATLKQFLKAFHCFSPSCTFFQETHLDTCDVIRVHIAALMSRFLCCAYIFRQNAYATIFPSIIHFIYSAVGGLFSHCKTCCFVLYIVLVDRTSCCPGSSVFTCASRSTDVKKI